ncbi:MAG: hypothetical protein O2810_05855 [Bacteroidetes bacterium]|nr:hypothetical protein [Bacteroidota bacterium]MDA0888594.1 hypothetical protein [Bacteroidota bacterium]MDA1085036.1 hypothetical protein [Bacteroidota bacterium]
MFELLYAKLLDEKTKKRSERIIINIAIVSFVLHLAIITLNDLKLLGSTFSGDLFTNPISAIYTPFSFILIYEVYLLIYYLPKSMTIYIGKQYEIIMLIVIRRLYKDLSNISLKGDWFESAENLQFIYDIIATIILFLLIHLFYKMNKFRVRKLMKLTETKPELIRFVRFKRALAVLLVPAFIVIALFNIFDWAIHVTELQSGLTKGLDINAVFFDDFFTVLILVDVLLVLFSFAHTDRFNKVIRNSGFVISTILVKLSFSVTGLQNVVLIISAVAFGVVILWIHKLFEQNKLPANY